MAAFDEAFPDQNPPWVAPMVTLRDVAIAMATSGRGAILVKSPLGPFSMVTARDVIEAVAAGVDPDLVWASDVARSAPPTVGCAWRASEIGAVMVRGRDEVVVVVDEGIPIALTSALDVLEAVLGRSEQNEQNEQNEEGGPGN